MLKRMRRLLKGNQKGITGLETAIILIAFVVVASVFAYAILSAGLYSSQKSQESVYQGLKQAQGAITVKGGVVAVSEHPGNNGDISQITFTIGVAMDGNKVDFTPPLVTGNNGRAPASSLNPVVVSYVDPYQKVEDLFWTLQRLGANNGDNILDFGELFQITIGSATETSNGGNLCDALAGHRLSINTRFTIELKTPTGATLTMERVTPAFIDNVMDLH
jgi:flagellin FlaB